MYGSTFVAMSLLVAGIILVRAIPKPEDEIKQRIIDKV